MNDTINGKALDCTNKFAIYLEVVITDKYKKLIIYFSLWINISDKSTGADDFQQRKRKTAGLIKFRFLHMMWKTLNKWLN